METHRFPYSTKQDQYTNTQTNINTGSALTVWLWISCNRQSDKGKENERGMSPAGVIQARSTNRETEWGNDIKRGQGKCDFVSFIWGLIQFIWRVWQIKKFLKTLKTIKAMKEPGPSSGSWLRSTSPAEVLMLLGLKWAGWGPSYQKWVLPRGTATDPCYWLWQSRHSGCLWAFHTHVGGTATHPNLTQLELILMRGDDG